MMDLSLSHDLDHIPRYVLVGDGKADSWDTFRYIDDLSRMRSAAIAMKNGAEEITSVVAYDLDDEGKEVATYSEDS